MSKLGIIDQGKSEGCAVGPTLNFNETRYGLKATEYKGKAALITLGCAKNQVDSEIMLGVLKQRGYEIVNDLQVADIAVVNTCGFLQSAIEESLDAVLEVADYKKTARLRKLIVAGCMVSRFQGDLKEAMPEVDAFITSQELDTVADVADGNMLESSARPYFFYDEALPRIISNANHSVYIKIAEGCNRPCTFCIIPKIRGKMHSRKPEGIIEEIKSLALQGVKEFNLVAQDLTDYGHDLEPRLELAGLLKKIDEALTISGKEAWVRMLYAYPVGTSEELLTNVQGLNSICEYVDIPLQHSSERLLKEMKRPIGRYSPRTIVQMIKEKFPKIAIRTTFIVGFPGETEEDIEDLNDFISQGYFSSVGIFTYSPETGTPSAEMPNQISQEVKDARKEKLMLTQQKLVQDNLQKYVGTIQRVLIDGEHQDTDLLLSGRTRFQAPDVDGTVIINDSELEVPLKIGDFCNVQITEVVGYDLCGKVVEQ